MNNSNNRIDVYLSKIPDDCIISDVYPQHRNIYINSSSNLRLRKERYWVWKLLEEAVNCTFGFNIEDIQFFETNGKWSCNGFHFSLSHTKGAVAVAISNSACGVDIENLNEYRKKKANKYVPLAKKICTKNEIEQIKNADDLISIWTKKESIFKSLESSSQSLFEIESSEYACETFYKQLEDQYIISVCCNNPENIRVITT